MLLYQILLVLLMLISIVMIALILIQHGKGASLGASFGAGASNTVFGAAGSGNFLSHTTAVLAGLFFVISLVLGAIYNDSMQTSEDFSKIGDEETTEKTVDTSAVKSDNNKAQEKSEAASAKDEVKSAAEDKKEVKKDEKKAEEKKDAPADVVIPH